MNEAEITNLRNQQARICVVHYSCENLGDSNQGLSPRITSIAVLDFSSKMMHSFSIHLIAEIKGVSRDQIPSNYDDLEREMLLAFDKFISEKSNAIWLHWNMSNINFGFEAIEHRFKVLTKQEAKKIADSNRKNLSSLIVGKYGDNCVDHPRMENLMKLNGGVSRDFLSGEVEVAAFSNKEYLKLHKSTMSKVYWFTHMIELLMAGKVKTQRSNLKERFLSSLESPVAKVIGLIASVVAVVQLICFLYSWVVSKISG